MAKIKNKNVHSLFIRCKESAGILSERNKLFFKNHKHGRTCNILHKRNGRAYLPSPSSKTKFEYNADYAQGKAVFEMMAKGVPLKLGKDMVLAEKIET